MKGLKVKEKLKKSLIVTIVAIMMAFMMPVKSRADIINDFIDLLLRIPDGAMHVIDSFIGGSDEFTYEQLEFCGGWDEGGRVYNFIVTPYDIFSSGSYEESNGEYYTKLGLLDINFFADRPIKSETPVSSEILAPVIGNVYKALRNLAMVLMLLVVLYIGIKIMISSIAAQQAKYKQLLVDWLVGFALLFVMHYIMSGIVYLNSVVVKMLSNEEGDAYYVSFAELEKDVNITQTTEESTWFNVAFNYSNDVFWDTNHLTGSNNGDKYQKFKDNRLIVRNSVKKDETFSSYIDANGRIDLNSVPRGTQSSYTMTLTVGYVGAGPAKVRKWGDGGVIFLAAKVINPGYDNEKFEDKAIVKLNTMSYVRTISSFGSEDNDSVLIYDNGGKKDMDIAGVMGYSILYLCLVIETIMFTFTYIKRVLQMAFLTMVAPIVAIMYPVDKIGDGKAQSFNTWFKDYLFNILIQPMHLLLYTIFIVAAAQLVSRNIIYALAIYGFMIPSEKYFKKLLGFEKASTGGGGPLGGAIGRGLAMDGLGRLAGIGPAARLGKGSSGGSENKRKKPKTKKITKNEDPIGPSGAGGFGGPGGSGGSSGSGSGGDSNSSGNPNGGGAPGAIPPKKKFGRLVGLRNALGDRIIRGATGGKYSARNIKFGHANAGGWTGERNKVELEALKTGGKFVGKKIARAIPRAAGIAALGSLGVVAGAATAMATGDINNLWKGAAVGAGAGNKFGKNIADRGESFVTDFGDEIKAYRADYDPAYRAELRQEQADEANKEMISELPPEDQPEYERVKDEYAPYMDEIVKGDGDMLKALVKLESEQDFQNISNKYEKIDIAQDAARFGSINDTKVEENYRKYLRRSKDEGGGGLQNATDDEINKRIRLVRIAQKAMNK